MQPTHSTRNSHQGSKCTGLDPSVDVVQNSSGFLFDLHIITDILEMEDCRLLFNGRVLSIFSASSLFRGGSTLSFFVLCPMLGLMRSREDDDFALGFLALDGFGGTQVNETETDNKDE